jgi:hypothetical protein
MAAPAPDGYNESILHRRHDTAWHVMALQHIGIIALHDIVALQKHFQEWGKKR